MFTYPLESRTVARSATRSGRRSLCALAAALLLLVPTLLVPVAARAQTDDPRVAECEDPGEDWVFCTGFEEGDLDLWDDWDDNPPETNLLMEDPGPQDIAGNHVCRLRAPEGRGGADLLKVLPDTYDVLYARWYVKWEPGYDFDARNHGGGLHAGSRSLLGHAGDRPAGDDWFSAWIEPHNTHHRLYSYVYYRGMYQDCADPNGSCWGDHFPCMVDEGQTYCTNPDHRETLAPPQPEPGRWYCVELMIDAGTPTTDGSGADGILNFWVDDVSYGPWTEMWFRTTPDLKLNIFWLNLWFHADHSEAGIMVDDVVVSTSRIGPRDAATETEPESWGATKARYGGDH